MSSETHTQPPSPGPEHAFRPLDAADFIELCRPSTELWSELTAAGHRAFERAGEDPRTETPAGAHPIEATRDPVDGLLRATVRAVLCLDLPASEPSTPTPTPTPNTGSPGLLGMAPEPPSSGSSRPPRVSVRQTSNPRRLHMLERASSQPLAFAQAVLETARHRAFASPEEALERQRTGTALVEGAGLDALDATLADDLRALARAYEADELRLAGKHLEAEGHISAARRKLRRSSHPEIRARILEIEADLACTVGEIGKSLRLLDEAEPLLAGCPIEGRSVSLHLRRARTDLARRRPDKALVSLRAGHRDLPADRAFRLRLELGHTSAMARLSLREHDEARAALAEILHLCTELYCDARLDSQRWWIQGHLAMTSESAEGAEEAMGLFGRAIEVFIEQGQTQDAFRTFVDWTVAAEKAGQLGNSRGPLQSVFRRLLEMPGVLDLGRLELRRWLEHSARLGIEVPSLDHLRERLGERGSLLN